MTWQLVSNLTLVAGTWTTSALFGGDLIRIESRYKKPNIVHRALLAQSLPTTPKLTIYDIKRIYLKQNTIEIFHIEPTANATFGGLRSISISTKEAGWTVRIDQWVT